MTCKTLVVKCKAPTAMHSLLPLLLWWSFCLTATTADNLEYPIFGYCPSNMDNIVGDGGAFEANLGVTLSSLPAAAATSSGFAKNITGTAPDQAYGLAQCRGDISAPECHSCLDGVVQELARMCHSKDGMLVREGCMLRYSDASFFGSLADEWSYPIFNETNLQDAVQPAQFKSRLSELMRNLTKKAAYESPHMFAVGTTTWTWARESSLFGMARCSRDIPADDCSQCLTKAVNAIPHCCDGKEGGKVFFRTCAIRFELYMFYNEKGAEAAMSLAPAPGADLFPQKSSGRNHRIRVVLPVLIPVPVALMVLLLVAVQLWICKRSRKEQEDMQNASASPHGGDIGVEEMRGPESLSYDLSTLRAATDNFSEENKLGEGGFGPVYKGTLENGKHIAVKRLAATSHQGQAEMKNEIVLVAKLQHRNLVRLLGFCTEEHERILVYEFLSNSSLDKILFDPARQKELTWGQTYKIIEGIGRGLLYLHEDSRLTIIHRDLKASNILLDLDMSPKISDFGLAKLFNVDSSMGNTNHIAGTYGYMAPEYALRGNFSTKSDVYSYGVLVLEIITGRRPSENLLSFVWGHWSRGSVAQLLQVCLADEPVPQETLRSIHVGLLCVQDDPHRRPSMASVIVMLNSPSVTLPAPAEPAFVVVTPSVSNGPRAAPPEPSINEGSISDLEPR